MDDHATQVLLELLMSQIDDGRSLEGAAIEVEGAELFVAFPDEPHTRRYMLGPESMEIVGLIEAGREIPPGSMLDLLPPRQA